MSSIALVIFCVDLTLRILRRRTRSSPAPGIYSRSCLTRCRRVRVGLWSALVGTLLGGQLCGSLRGVEAAGAAAVVVCRQCVQVSGLARLGRVAGRGRLEAGLEVV